MILAGLFSRLEFRPPFPLEGILNNGPYLKLFVFIEKSIIYFALPCQLINPVYILPVALLLGADLGCFLKRIIGGDDALYRVRFR